MPNFDEKQAFEHGIIAMSKVLAVFARIEFKNHADIAHFLKQLALDMQESSSMLSGMYIEDGFEKTLERIENFCLPVE